MIIIQKKFSINVKQHQNCYYEILEIIQYILNIKKIGKNINVRIYFKFI